MSVIQLPRHFVERFAVPTDCECLEVGSVFQPASIQFDQTQYFAELLHHSFETLEDQFPGVLPQLPWVWICFHSATVPGFSFHRQRFVPPHLVPLARASAAKILCFFEDAWFERAFLACHLYCEDDACHGLMLDGRCQECHQPARYVYALFDLDSK